MPIHNGDSTLTSLESSTLYTKPAHDYLQPFCTQLIAAPMSLKALPTELDERILGFLDREDLSVISQTSQYYQEIAEPHLYRRIVFAANQNHNAWRLLLTLLSRRGLAAHIEEVEVARSLRPQPTRERWSNKDTQRLEAALPSIQSAIAAILGRHYAKSGIRMAWLASVIAPDDLEGTIAFIACMATNIELLSYTSLMADPRTSESFLSQILAEVASRPSMSKRLTKLNKLVLHSIGHVEIPRLPSLGSVAIADSRHVTFLQYVNLPMRTNLRKIEVLHSFGRTFLPDFLHRDRVPHLKTLIFRDRWGVPGTNYQEIVDKLETECPRLQYLKLTIDGPQQATPVTPLTGLQCLVELTTLCTDMAFLLTSGRYIELLSSGSKLPPKLTRLDIN